MHATAENMKNKDSSFPMALRVVATECAVSFTNTALRRGETRSGAGPVVEILKSEFVSKCGAGYIESFDAKNRSSDPKLGQSQNRKIHHSGVNALASLCKLWCRPKALKPRWRPFTRANYLSVLANPSLNRTHCSVPSFGLEKPSPNASPPQWAG